MLSSGIIDLAVGIAFVFGVTAAISSVITELIARFLGLRGAFLLLGLRELLDGTDETVNVGAAEEEFDKARDLINAAADRPAPERPVVSASPGGGPVSQPAPAARADAEGAPAAGQSATSVLLGSPILRSQGMAGQIFSRKLTLSNGASNRNPLPVSQNKTGVRGWFDTMSQRRGLPSYIPARSVSEAIIGLVVPDKAGQTTMTEIRAYIGELPLPMLRKSLLALASNADDDITKFRTSVEAWYDDHMDRVSGWYKRHVARITLAAGAVLVLLLNINTITIGRALYSDSAVRSAVATAAAKAGSCPDGTQQSSCLADLETRLTTAAQAGLPLGWGTVTDCAAAQAHCNLLDQRGIFSRHGGSAWQLLLVLIGFLLTIVALTPGAQFWFGLITKLGSLRSTGPPPPR